MLKIKEEQSFTENSETSCNGFGLEDKLHKFRRNASSSGRDQVNLLISASMTLALVQVCIEVKSMSKVQKCFFFLFVCLFMLFF